MPKPTTRQVHRSIVEVERKFRVEPDSLARLKANSGNPPFRSLQYLGNTTFEDKYYDDKKCTLSASGIWVRLRNRKWEAKVRQGGNFTNSQFEELSGRPAVAALILNCNIPESARAFGKNTRFGLQETARFRTIREAWKVDERKFKIVLDSTDFGHSVGEVELEHVMEIEKDSELLAAERKAMTIKMDGIIEAFMLRYSWAFPSGKPVGKLSAYFAWKKKASDSG